MPTLEVPPNLRDYLRRLVRRKWHFFVPFVLALIAAGYAFYTKPKKYRATGVVRREDPVLLRALGQQAGMAKERSTESASLAPPS